MFQQPNGRKKTKKDYSPEIKAQLQKKIKFADFLFVKGEKVFPHLQKLMNEHRGKPEPIQMRKVTPVNEHLGAPIKEVTTIEASSCVFTPIMTHHAVKMFFVKVQAKESLPKEKTIRSIDLDLPFGSFKVEGADANSLLVVNCGGMYFAAFVTYKLEDREMYQTQWLHFIGKHIYDAAYEFVVSKQPKLIQPQNKIIT